jgi:hypothetical protein
VLDGFSLPAKICQSAGADGLSLVGKSHASLKTLGASIEAVRSRKQLLALLHIDV